ncbi:serine hydrolase domain-containing protein [Actinocorallia sp. B10E7]|uniref:serine hydrolase domain-containing protein n=1 Tax=Actinocorallia sp. B10E7 TaxID=3153558 RepID=UPI00325DCDCB
MTLGFRCRAFPAVAALGLAGSLAVSACGENTSQAERAGLGVLTVSPEAGVLSSRVSEKLDRAVKGVMKETKAPGVIVGLWMDGGGYVRAFGVADKATRAPMSTGLFMKIGSETKTFTVTALLRLADQGRLGLDDPVSKYVSGVPNGDRITLRQLAGMKSGLYPYTSDPGFQKAVLADPKRSFTPRQLLAYSFGHRAVFKPGEKFQYSNTNTILLGLVVEKVGGRPLREFVRREVLVPARLRRTLFPRGTEFPRPHAQGYTRQAAGGRLTNATGWNPSWAWAAGAMISTMEDMRSWAQTLATGTLLSPATQAERMKDPYEPFPGLRYGLGMFEVRGWLGHNGSLPGYQSVVVHLPARRATLVVLTNTDTSHKGRDVGTLFANAVTRVATPENVYNLPATPSSPAPSRTRD